MKRSEPDWSKIKHAYEQTDSPQTEICKQFGVGRTALRSRAKNEGWERPVPVRRGPPPKSEPETPDGQVFNSAEEYLEAVVAGTTPPDSVRVSAARILMAYQLPRVRAPLLAEKTPRRQAISDANAMERVLIDEWAEKAAAVRKRLEKVREKQEQ